MTYVICEPCIGVKDGTCTQVCPVDCIYTDPDADQYFIHPDECIDCAACEPVCPVNAIYPAESVPQRWLSYIEKNAEYFGKGAE